METARGRKAECFQKGDTVVKTEIVLQYNGKDVTDKDIVEKVKKKKKKKSGSYQIYVQPENNCAYYTINNEGGDDKVVELF